jgi:hypothetical protein
VRVGPAIRVLPQAAAPAPTGPVRAGGRRGRRGGSCPGQRGEPGQHPRAAQGRLGKVGRRRSAPLRGPTRPG